IPAVDDDGGAGHIAGCLRGKQYGHRLVLNLTGGKSPARAAGAPAARAVRPDSGGSRDIVVAVDAGHGGEDVGAIGPSGVYEKDIVLAISRELVAAINRLDGMRGVLVRNGDYYVGLRSRMVKARAAEADLFVSIHADAFKDRRVRGSSVYVLSQRGASSEAARWLAENENASDLIGGVSLDDKDDVLKSVLLDLSQTASLDASIDAANAILSGLKRLGKVHKRDVQHAGFMVLKSPDIPSLLIETAFISNPDEERRLRSKAFQRELAASMAAGIRAYFEQNTPPGTRLAEARRHRVSRGDTLSVIADRYDVSMESIKLANNLSGDGVRLGEVLKIP
ncbi:MAG: N-acetylmuramoyl-L-alanine amidase, partial [Gammaproteobacteria bacterium]